MGVSWSVGAHALLIPVLWGTQNPGPASGLVPSALGFFLARVREHSPHRDCAHAQGPLLAIASMTS